MFILLPVCVVIIASTAQPREIESDTMIGPKESILLQFSNTYNCCKNRLELEKKIQLELINILLELNVYDPHTILVDIGNYMNKLYIRLNGIGIKKSQFILL